MYYDYRTIPQSQSPRTPGVVFGSSIPTYTASPNITSQSRRGSSYEPATFTYASPRPPSYYSPPTFAYATPQTYTTTPKKDDFATSTERIRVKTRRFVDRDSIKIPARSTSTKKQQPHATSRSHFIHKVDVVDKDRDSYGYDYSPKGSPPPPYNDGGFQNNYWASQYHSYGQEKATKQAEPPEYKAKPRATTSSSAQPKSASQEKKKPSVKSLPKATAEDAVRAGIPVGYSYKNWDPTEEPIFLLGSVFDANSLGKWIYDWTVYHYRPSTPMADLAGDLWLLMIQLAGKIKRAEECRPRIRRLEDRDLVDDFLDSGDRLWARLGKILKTCEDYMWKVAKKERAKKDAPVSMGAKSGCEFVECMFGRERKLEETEKLMTGMRLWSMRFDANCEDIMRFPAG